MAILPTDNAKHSNSFHWLRHYNRFFKPGFCSEHFISIKHRILATFNTNKNSILTACMPLRRKSKDGWFGIRIMCPGRATYVSGDCCFTQNRMIIYVFPFWSYECEWLLFDTNWSVFQLNIMAITSCISMRLMMMFTCTRLTCLHTCT